MKKLVLLLIALVCASFTLTSIATFNSDHSYNYFIEGCNSAIESAELSNSFAAKQVTLYNLDLYLNKLKIELQDELKQLYIREPIYGRWDDYVQIQKIENKIKAINIVFAKLNDAIAKIEKQFSIPAGQFKFLAARLTDIVYNEPIIASE